MEKVKEVVDKIVHPKAHDSTHTGNAATHGTHTGTTGTHTGTTGHSSGVTGTSGTAGPHSSNAANKVDPRVDSDMDGSRNAGAAQYGPGSHLAGNNANSGLIGTNDTAGPHSSNLANKADPRVDSDLDGSRNAGASSYGTGAHNTGNSGFGSSNTGYGSNNSGLTGTTGSSTATGPHNSSMLNKIDPRVDSDRDGSRNAGAAQHGPGSHNTGSAGYSHSTTTGSTNHGPYDSNIANKADPRVDSDRDGKSNFGAANHGPGANQQHGTFGGVTSGPGPAPNTAGPHTSNMANKLDPRVDSDRDGSKTVGSAPQQY